MLACVRQSKNGAKHLQFDEEVQHCNCRLNITKSPKWDAVLLACYLLEKSKW